LLLCSLYVVINRKTFFSWSSLNHLNHVSTLSIVLQPCLKKLKWQNNLNPHSNNINDESLLQCVANCKPLYNKTQITIPEGEQLAKCFELMYDTKVCSFQVCHGTCHSHAMHRVVRKGCYTVCPRIEFTRGKKCLFLILRKNFRGITFFTSSETPISVIKKSFSTQRKT
jgi:hypothetical protein